MKRGLAIGALTALAALGGPAAGGPDPRVDPGPTERANASANANVDAALALTALDRRVANLEAEEELTKKEMASLGPKLADLRARVVASGRALYRSSRVGMLPIGGGFEALVTHAMRVERARRALASELGGERALRSRGAELARSLERIAQDKGALASQRAAMDAARVASQEDSRRHEAFERAFETSSGSSEYVAIYGGSGTSSDPVAIGGFSGSRGRLLFPVLGRAEVRPAKREGEGDSGLEIRAPLGATVRAVFAGRVAFADRYGAYGRIVILDHGERYYTVSGNLATVDVRVGDEVSAGERIGGVGDEGQGPLLYFELRHGSQTVPAGPWLGVDQRR
jgi:murein DD-endopeptidase MepM/ murein hydrolase activator NlpD